MNFNDINYGYRAAILKKNSLWLLPFYMTVATYCYYEKVCRTMHTAILSYLLNSDTAKFLEKFAFAHGQKRPQNRANYIFLQAFFLEIVQNICFLCIGKLFLSYGLVFSSPVRLQDFYRQMSQEKVELCSGGFLQV